MCDGRRRPILAKERLLGKMGIRLDEIRAYGAARDTGEAA
jgi:hypothetical protein